jgi:hypothetical protein
MAAGAVSRRRQIVQVSPAAQKAMLGQLTTQAATIREAELVLGYPYDEEVDRVPDEPPEFGEVTAAEIVRAGAMGHRGRAAVRAAAAWHRTPPRTAWHRTPPRTIPVRCVRPRQGRAPRRSVRTRTVRSGCSPGRSTDDPEPDLVHLAEALG